MAGPETAPRGTDIEAVLFRAAMCGEPFSTPLRLSRRAVAGCGVGHRVSLNTGVNEWIYDRSVDPLAHAGFVYVIENRVSGRSYVGRKYVFTERGGRKPGRKTETNWRTYWGSCKPLLLDVQRLGKAAFTRHIVGWYDSRAETNYAEVGLQFRLDVLSARLADGTPAFYNRNILARYFAGSVGKLL